MAAKRFTATLIQDDRTSGCGIRLPFNPKAAFGRARAPVTVSINGYTFRTTTCPMGGQYWIGVNRAHRERAGVAAGDRVAVTMELDTKLRIVKPPADFSKALRASPPASEAWQKLSYSHQKAYAEAIDEAVKPEARQRRIAQTIEMLAARAPARAAALSRARATR